MCLIVLKSGNLNLLEPTRSVQACLRFAVPLPLRGPFVNELIFGTLGK